MKNQNETNKTWLKTLLNSGKIDSADKERLKEIAADLDVKIPTTPCKDCWVDLAVLCLKKLNAREPKAAAPRGKWSVREGLDVYFGAVRVNADTIDDALAERLLAKGFPRHLLVENKPKAKKDDESNGKD